MTARMPSRVEPLAAQSRDEPVPYSLLANTTSGTFSALYFIAASYIVIFCFVGIVDRHAAFDARHHLVLDADVGEGAAHHHLVIAAPRAVLVEVLRPHLMVAQVFAGRAFFLDRAGRRDVVGRDRVEEQAEDARIDDVLDRRAASSPCPRNTAGSARRSNGRPTRR